MDIEYYFISDLHIGGDAALEVCDFEPELIVFLRELERKGRGTELIIIGDVFGLWEMTEVAGVDKLTTIIGNHRDLFEQFRRTGERTRITVLPGNHDYELVCYPDCAARLAEHNIVLEPKEHITRTVAGRTVWIEHGSQHDSFNAISDFGNPYVTPLGYYITSKVVGNAGKYSLHAKGRWLKDLESVYPNEYIPDWILSNYFYREMSPLLRWMLLPFLMLFGVSVVAYAGMWLERAGIIGTSFFNRSLVESLGVFGKLFYLFFMVNSAIITFLVILAIPLWFVYRDVIRTLDRYGLKTTEKLRGQKEDEYRRAARRVFENDPEAAVFIFGHTHEAFLETDGVRAIVNTGTWLKKMTKVRSHFRLLPDVYYPSFLLNYFRVREEDGRVAIDYRRIRKEFKFGLTLNQRLVTLGRRPKGEAAIPERTILEAG